MNNQLNVYYVISFLMVGTGLLMLNDAFNLESVQMNSINIGAAILTFSSVMLGSVLYEKISKIFKFIGTIAFIFGSLFIFAGFLMPGFDDTFFLKDLLKDMDTNSLVLVCLGVTIASFVQFDQFLRNSIKSNSKKYESQIEKLEEEKKDLVEALKKANDFIEKQRGKNE